ncbi:hypothetical protein [Pseudoxanthomonas sp. 10H]|uniref:hypothetical protein n=1 Tax=Pseudoxanthomonas sp. 10H TaxID=3242729 RepID=UPI003556B9F7
MKKVALCALLVVPLASSAFAAGMAGAADSPELPTTLTRSGVKFVNQCDDAAFARTSIPNKLAQRCAALLELWRAEAGTEGNWANRGVGIARGEAAVASAKPQRVYLNPERMR